MIEFHKIVKAFFSKHKEKSILTEAQVNYSLKPFKMTGLEAQTAVEAYEKLQNKYEKQEYCILQDQWYKNQRKLFIQLLFYYCKICNTSPEKMASYQWQFLSSIFFSKDPLFLKFQGFSMLKDSAKIQWSPEDDEIIRTLVKKVGLGRWNQISKHFFLSSCAQKFFPPKQIRERWFNHISDNVKHCQWSSKEDLLLLEHVHHQNKKWCRIVKLLNYTRTEHMIKNRYNFLVRKSRRTDYHEEGKAVVQLIKKLRNQINTQQKIKNNSEKLQKHSHLNSIHRKTRQKQLIKQQIDLLKTNEARFSKKQLQIQENLNANSRNDQQNTDTNPRFFCTDENYFQLAQVAPDQHESGQHFLALFVYPVPIELLHLSQQSSPVVPSSFTNLGLTWAPEPQNVLKSNRADNEALSN